MPSKVVRTLFRSLVENGSRLLYQACTPPVYAQANVAMRRLPGRWFFSSNTGTCSAYFFTNGPLCLAGEDHECFHDAR
jgi:hypothetical protein